MRIIKDICGATHGSARDIENWIARIKLRTAYEPTKRGRARRYTLENTLELAIMVAYVRGGVRPAMASLFAGSKIAHPGYKPQDLVVKGERGDTMLFGIASLSMRSMPPHLRDSDVLIVVKEKQVVDRARSFFAEHSTEVDDYVQVPIPELEEADLVFMDSPE